MCAGYLVSTSGEGHSKCVYDVDKLIQATSKEQMKFDI